MTALPVFRGVSALEMCTLAPMVLAADAWARRAPFRKAPCSDVFVRLRVSQIHSRCEWQLTERLAGEHAVFETERAMLVRERERLAAEVRSLRAAGGVRASPVSPVVGSAGADSDLQALLLERTRQVCMFVCVYDWGENSVYGCLFP
jgi:hypothetical protein